MTDRDIILARLAVIQAPRDQQKRLRPHHITQRPQDVTSDDLAQASRRLLIMIKEIDVSVLI